MLAEKTFLVNSNEKIYNVQIRNILKKKYDYLQVSKIPYLTKSTSRLITVTYENILFSKISSSRTTSVELERER